MMSLETKPQQYFVRIEINVIGTLMMLLYLPSLMPFYGQNFPHNFNFGSLLILLYFLFLSDGRRLIAHSVL